MDVDKLVETFRSEVHDVADPPLWTDDDIYGYLDESQKLFCRLAVGISDSSSDLTVVAFSAGDEYATYDPRILRIRMARRGSDYYQLDVKNFEDFMSGGALSMDYGVLQPATLDLREGPVRCIITNMEQNKIRLVYVPEADDTVLLTVYRLPLNTISADNSNQLEIDEQHHRSLLFGMKYLAYLKEDAETFDKSRSKDNEMKFRNYCDEVKGEVARREHKVRVVAYGGL